MIMGRNRVPGGYMFIEGLAHVARRVDRVRDIPQDVWDAAIARSREDAPKVSVYVIECALHIVFKDPPVMGGHW